MYVGVVALVTIPTLGLAYLSRLPLADLWGPAVLSIVALLLENKSTALRGGGATGNISFVIHLAALLLFGPFWAAAVAATSTAASQAFAGRPPARIIFNSCQKALSIVLAGWAYSAIGGSTPLGFLRNGLSSDFSSAIVDTTAFLVAVVVLFLANSILVSAAVGISSGKSFMEVWRANTLWVLGYDVASSVLGVLVAWLYTIFDKPEEGLTRFGFLAIFLPIIAVRHVYLKLNSLQGLHEALQASHEELERNVREQLDMMVMSIEARDPYTSGHSVRVAELSRAIARDYGLNDELVNEIWNAALLHDVGKIHAEFAPLLSKEGKLTPEEWEIMKTHSQRSADLVGLFGRFRGHVQEAVRHHHERWDGRGYPVGLSGEAIPLGARIIMIADTIDAMTTDRPYRQALGLEVVVAELKKYSGTQFSPYLVDIAVNSVSVRSIITRAPEPGADVPVSVHPSQRSHLSFFTPRTQEV